MRRILQDPAFFYGLISECKEKRGAGVDAASPSETATVR
jgi:hypothetical protein